MQSNLAQFREFPNLSALSIRRLSGERPSLEAKSGVGRFSQGVAICHRNFRNTQMVQSHLSSGN